jgi:hypothetical protein
MWHGGREYLEIEDGGLFQGTIPSFALTDRVMNLKM